MIFLLYSTSVFFFFQACCQPSMKSELFVLTLTAHIMKKEKEKKKACYISAKISLKYFLIILRSANYR